MCISLAQYALGVLSFIILFILDIIDYLLLNEVNILRIFFEVFALVSITIITFCGEPMTFLALLIAAVIISFVFAVATYSPTAVSTCIVFAIILTAYLLMEFV